MHMFPIIKTYILIFINVQKIFEERTGVIKMTIYTYIHEFTYIYVHIHINMNIKILEEHTRPIKMTEDEESNEVGKEYIYLCVYIDKHV
jgi:hypothetical protein